MTTVPIAGKGPLGRLTRNRPDKLKALTRAMRAEPGAVSDTATADAPCRLRTGTGRAVSTRQERSAAVGPSAALQRENRQTGYNPAIRQIAMREKPVIAAVNGIVAGADVARLGIGRAPGVP